MNLYGPEGYVDAESIYLSSDVYTFITGARGTGKTYGFLKYFIDNGLHFILLRRTQKQVKMIKKPDLNPFRSLENDGGEKYHADIKSLGDDVSGIFLNGEERPSGLMMPLTTISSLRGFDASQTDVLLYDEFIPELHEKAISNEGGAFLNAIETIARNRELKGHEPMKVICLANSNRLANPIYIELKIVNRVFKMTQTGQEVLKIPERNMTVIHLKQSPISLKKAETSLYKLAGSGSFSDMALENRFNEVEESQIRSMNLKEYRPLVAVGEIVIYRHKSALQYYVTDHLSGHPPVYQSSEIELSRFRNDYYGLKLSHLNRHIFFQNYMLMILFQEYMKM